MNEMLQEILFEKTIDKDKNSGIILHAAFKRA